MIQAYLPNVFSLFMKLWQEMLLQGLAIPIGPDGLVLDTPGQSPSWQGVLGFVSSLKIILLLISKDPKYSSNSLRFFWPGTICLASIL